MGRRGQKHDKTGRSKSGDKFVKLFLCTMQSPAWRALSAYAQRLYPWLLLEWDGPGENNNGRISLSGEQASKALGCHTETARLALIDLQAKGFLVVTRCAARDSDGRARCHLYEITELGTAANPIPSKRFLDWKPGSDLPVVRAKANNPGGIGGFKKLEDQPTEPTSNCLSEPTEPAPTNLRHRLVVTTPTNLCRRFPLDRKSTGPKKPTSSTLTLGSGKVLRNEETESPPQYSEGRFFDKPEADLTALRERESEAAAIIREEMADQIEERAAILEYDAGFPRAEAERRARAEHPPARQTRFAVVRGGFPIRVGVRTLKSPELTRNRAQAAQT